jgi:hypothetical protein
MWAYLLWREIQRPIANGLTSRGEKTASGSSAQTEVFVKQIPIDDLSFAIA